MCGSGDSRRVIAISTRGATIQFVTPLGSAIRGLQRQDFDDNNNRRQYIISRDRSWQLYAAEVEYPVYQVVWANDRTGFQVNSNVVLTLRFLPDTNAFVFRTAINNTELATAGIQAKYLQGRINEVNRIHREEYFPEFRKWKSGNAWTKTTCPRTGVLIML